MMDPLDRKFLEFVIAEIEWELAGRPDIPLFSTAHPLAARYTPAPPEKLTKESLNAALQDHWERPMNSGSKHPSTRSDPS